MGRDAKKGTIIALVVLVVAAAAVFAAVALAEDSGSTAVPGPTATAGSVQGAVEYTPAPVAEKSPAGGTCAGPGSSGCARAGANAGESCPMSGQTGSGVTDEKAGAAPAAGSAGAGGCCDQ